jgi:hypothetical protein
MTYRSKKSMRKRDFGPPKKGGGAGNRNRTCTGLPPVDFESTASTSSAIPAARPRSIGAALPPRK